MSDKIEITKLDNGLRIITDYAPSVHSVGVGIWTGVGTRDEDLKNNGVAHMVEHMLFKGTKNRNALEIVEEAENLGASMNAYTGRDITSYHIHGLAEDLDVMSDILADMYQNSTLPDKEIEKERHVIIQEIGMTNDTPDDLVFDQYFETAYQNQAFGAPILGTAEIISGMKKDALQSHITNFYTPENTVISAAGKVDHDIFVQKIERLFSSLPENKHTAHKPAQYTGGDQRLEKELEQSHFILGFEGLARVDDDFMKAKVLATLFGGGMSSRLFQEVREKRGLVYTTYAFHSANHDTGQFAIYAGTSPDKMDEIIPVVCDEILKLTHTLKEEELRRAKNQIKASLLMGRESMMRRADQQARHVLFHEEAFNPEKTATEIEEISIYDLQKVAARILKNKITLAALGPLSKLEPFEKIEERLAS